MKVLITGSDGYIGSCLYKFLKKKSSFKLFCLDKKIKEESRTKYKIDLTKKNKINKLLSSLKPDLVVHLAGQSTVDGIKNKSIYVKNNILATKNLLTSMKKNNIKNIIFSSTAAVYKHSKKILKENSTLLPNNIYGKTKLKCEKLILGSSLNFIILRFFNVSSSIIALNVGEKHSPETHLIPICVHKAIVKKKIKIYGKNFKTFDGTCVRDYFHIIDLCSAIKSSIELLKKNNKIKKILNLGNGRGFSIIEIINRLKFLVGPVEFLFAKKRKGDIGSLVCDNSNAKTFLKWQPKFSNLKKIIKDEFLWQKNLRKINYKRQFIY